MILAARILMSLAILQFSIIPLIADLGRSHARNPDWPRHARSHVVTQVLTTFALGVLALYFLWSGRVPVQLGLCLAAMLGAAALLPFFASLVAGPLFGGSITPPQQGVARLKLGRIDGNVINFGLSAVLLAAGRLVGLA